MSGGLGRASWARAVSANARGLTRWRRARRRGSSSGWRTCQTSAEQLLAGAHAVAVDDHQPTRPEALQIRVPRTPLVARSHAELFAVERLRKHGHDGLEHGALALRQPAQPVLAQR